MGNYKSKNVVATQGDDAISEAVRLSGYTHEEVEKIVALAEEIIDLAKASGCAPDECFNACINVMVNIIMQQSPENRMKLVSGITECFIAALGGGSDQGGTPKSSEG